MDEPQPVAEIPAVQTDAPTVPRPRRWQFSLAALFVLLTLVSLGLAWYANTPSPPRLDTTSRDAFQNSVRAIKGPLWEADERRFLYALGRYGRYGGTGHSVEQLPPYWDSYPAELWIAEPVYPERVDFLLIDERVDELHGMTGREIIEYMELKFGPAPQPKANASSS